MTSLIPALVDFLTGRRPAAPPPHLVPPPPSLIDEPFGTGGADPDKFTWERTHKPRHVEGRGLGINERDTVWVDKDGDHWRWNETSRSWQNRIRRDGAASSWYTVPTEYGLTSACYAPYTEIPYAADEPEPANTQAHRDHLYLDCLMAFGTGNYSRGFDLLNQWLTKTYRWFGELLASSAAGEASAHGQRGPSAEESPAPEASPGAGHPSLNRNDLMDAARAVRLYSDQILDPLRPHWDKLATRLEFAAIVAPR